MPDELNPGVAEATPVPSEPSAMPQAAEPSESASESDPAEEGEQPRFNKDRGFQRRINDLTARRARAEAERDFLRAELERVRQERSGGQQSAAREPGNDDAPPVEEQFPSYQEYIEARAQWAARREFKRLNQQTEAQQRQWAAQAEEEQLLTNYRRKAEDFMKTTPDFGEAIMEATGQVSPQLQRAVLESEMSPQLAYHLAKNPDETERLNRLAPAALYRELGKLEAKLSSVPKPQPAVSKAPAPIAPLSGGKASGAPFDPYKAKTDDPGWDAWRANRSKKTA